MQATTSADNLNEHRIHSTRWGVIAHLAIIFVAVFICYANTLNHNFVYDDKDEMLENPIIHSLRNVPRFFTTSTYGYYRPLRTLVWAIDYAFWKEKPSGYHMTNLILYVFACWSLYWFLVLLFQNHAQALITSLLFLTHPIHTESIAWISGRGDPLAATFLFLSLCCTIRWAHNSPARGRSKGFGLWAVAMILFVFSVLSKESGITLPIILIALTACSHREQPLVRRRLLWSATASGVILLLLILLRFHVLRSLTPSNSPINDSRWNNVLFAAMAFWRYVGLMAVPVNLSADYPAAESLILNGSSVVSAILGHIAVTTLVAVLIVKRRTGACFAIVWIYATYLPVSNLVPLNQSFSEKYMFLPVLGMCILLGTLWTLPLPKTQTRTLRIFLGVLLIFYTVATIQRNKVWKDEVTLWTRTLSDQPESGLAAYNLACEYDRLGQSEKAIQYYLRAISLRPEDARQYQNLGNLYLNLNRMTDAIECYKKTISMGLVTPHVYAALGAAIASLGHLKQGQAIVEKSLDMNPNYVPGLYNLSLILRDRGMTDEADKVLERAHQLNPSVGTQRRGWIQTRNN